MEKKKWLTVVIIILVWAVGLACTIFFMINKSSVKVPIDHYMDALNNNDISEIPKAFHEYCSLAIEQNLSEEEFDYFIDGISQYYGSDYVFSYEIVEMSSMSQEDIEKYETQAKNVCSNYPYLSNGGTIKFDDIYNITTEVTLKGEYYEDKRNAFFTVVKIDNKCYFLHTNNINVAMFMNY